MSPFWGRKSPSVSILGRQIPSGPANHPAEPSFLTPSRSQTHPDPAFRHKNQLVERFALSSFGFLRRRRGGDPGRRPGGGFAPPARRAGPGPERPRSNGAVPSGPLHYYQGPPSGALGSCTFSFFGILGGFAPQAPQLLGGLRPPQTPRRGCLGAFLFLFYIALRAMGVIGGAFGPPKPPQRARLSFFGGYRGQLGPLRGPLAPGVALPGGASPPQSPPFSFFVGGYGPYAGCEAAPIRPIAAHPGRRPGLEWCKAEGFAPFEVHSTGRSPVECPTNQGKALICAAIWGQLTPFWATTGSSSRIVDPKGVKGPQIAALIRNCRSNSLILPRSLQFCRRFSLPHPFLQLKSWLKRPFASQKSLFAPICAAKGVGWGVSQGESHPIVLPQLILRPKLYTNRSLQLKLFLLRAKLLRNLSPRKKLFR